MSKGLHCFDKAPAVSFQLQTDDMLKAFSIYDSVKLPGLYITVVSAIDIDSAAQVALCASHKLRQDGCNVAWFNFDSELIHNSPYARKVAA